MPIYDIDTFIFYLFPFLRGPGNFNDFLNKSGLDAPFVQRKSGKISWIVRKSPEGVCYTSRGDFRTKRKNKFHKFAPQIYTLLF